MATEDISQSPLWRKMYPFKIKTMLNFEDYFIEENELIKKLFDLDEILAFQLEHNVEVLRGEDYQYLCYIDRKGYGTSLTLLGALTIGIKQFKEKQSNCS